MTKMQNLLNLANKIDAPIKVMNSNTVLIQKRIFQMLSLAKRLHISVIIESEQPRPQEKKSTTISEPQPPHLEPKYKCFFCGEVVDPKNDNAGSCYQYGFFHLLCEKQYRTQQKKPR